VRSFARPAFARLAFAGALLAVSGAAHAALSCSVPAGVSLNFGTYDDSSAATRDVSTAFSVSCCRTGAPNPTAGTMTITIGVSANSNQINTRQMKNTGNADLMSYQLYINSFGGTIWGDGVSGGSAFTQNVSIGTLCAAQQAVVVGSAIFGRIFAQQAVSAGSYVDTLTISINP
jgi:spore coat protein U-like protein